MGSSKNHGMTQQIDDAGAVSTRDETTMEERNIVKEAEDKLAEDRTKSSAVTTASSESKQTGDSSNLHTSSEPSEEETEPTEMFDEGSPTTSNMAVYGSDSVHSDASEASTVQNDPKRNGAAAVDPNKVEAMGGQFEGSSTGREAASFYNPDNDTEARYIIDMVEKANSEPSKLTVYVTRY